MSLLETALKVPSNRNKKEGVTSEHIELALAWLKSEVGIKQVSVALNKHPQSGHVLYMIAIYLREAYRKGNLTIKK
jgi:hypothetical protein